MSPTILDSFLDSLASDMSRWCMSVVLYPFQSETPRIPSAHNSQISYRGALAIFMTCGMIAGVAMQRSKPNQPGPGHGAHARTVGAY